MSEAVMAGPAPEQRFPVLDCRINALNLPLACAAVDDLVDAGSGGYVCFVNVHTCVTSRHDSRLCTAINESALAMPDGKPIAKIGQRRGGRLVQRVGGPDFLDQYIARSPHRRHFFMGATEQTLSLLIDRIRSRVPEANIVGSYAPPFGPFDESVSARMITKAEEHRAEVIWLGLGAPKQEYWMRDNWQALRPAVVLGVGAAFDFHAGVVKRAPKWVQEFGFEWLHRLAQEPGRLWRRYLVTNTQFLFYMVAEFFKRPG